MAFVPGHKHDLFLSYAVAEADWVDAFKKALCREFQDREGRAIEVWQDRDDIRPAESWSEALRDAVREAAMFLAVISPRYHESKWCADERRELLAYHGGLDKLRVSDRLYRFLKVIARPGPDQRHRQLFSDLQHIRFFNESTSLPYEPGSPEFKAQIGESVRALKELLQLMRNAKRQLYLAPGSLEMADDRQSLESELRDKGYNVRPDALLTSDYGADPVRAEMEQVELAVFLLGADHDQFVEDQIEVAKEFKRPLIFWIHPDGHKRAVGKQRDLIKLVSESRDMPAGSQVLGGASIRGMIEQLVGVLHPKEIVLPISGNGRAKVYLVFDSTLAPESQSATHLGDMLREKSLEVLTESTGEHEQLMRACNGLLLLRTAAYAPDPWLRLQVREFSHAEALFEREFDFDAKAAIVSDPNRLGPIPNTDLVPYSDPLPEGAIESFVSKLRKAKVADAAR